MRSQKPTNALLPAFDRLPAKHPIASYARRGETVELNAVIHGVWRPKAEQLHDGLGVEIERVAGIVARTSALLRLQCLVLNDLLVQARRR